MPVVGPHIARSKLPCGSQMHGVRCSQKHLARRGDQQHSSSPQQRFAYWNEIPQSVPCVLGESGGEVSSFLSGRYALAEAAMQDGVKLG